MHLYTTLQWNIQLSVAILLWLSYSSIIHTVFNTKGNPRLYVLVNVYHYLIKHPKWKSLGPVLGVLTFLVGFQYISISLSFIQLHYFKTSRKRDFSNLSDGKGKTPHHFKAVVDYDDLRSMDHLIQYSTTHNGSYSGHIPLNWIDNSESDPILSCLNIFLSWQRKKST